MTNLLKNYEAACAQVRVAEGDLTAAKVEAANLQESLRRRGIKRTAAGRREIDRAMDKIAAAWDAVQAARAVQREAEVAAFVD